MLSTNARILVMKQAQGLLQGKLGSTNRPVFSVFGGEIQRHTFTSTAATYWDRTKGVSVSQSQATSAEAEEDKLWYKPAGTYSIISRKGNNWGQAYVACKQCGRGFIAGNGADHECLPGSKRSHKGNLAGSVGSRRSGAGRCAPSCGRQRWPVCGCELGALGCVIE